MDKGLHILEPIIGIGLISIIFAVLSFSLKFIYRFCPVSVENERKIMHLVSGICLLSLPWIFQSLWSVLIVVSALIIGPYFVHAFPWSDRLFGRTLHVQRKSIGGPLFGLAFLILFAISEHHKLFYLISGLVVVIADAAAAMIGSKAPWLPYRIFGYQKSTSGSIAFFLAAFFCTLIPCLFSAYDDWLIIQVSLTVAFIATLIEAFSPFGLDNLTVPLGVFSVLYYILVFK